MQKGPQDVSWLVLFLSSPCVTNKYFSSQYQYIIVKRTGIKWEQGQISTICVEYCLIQHQIIKPSKIRNVWQTGQFIWKSVEWKGQLISTQSLPYIINTYWQNLRTSVLSGRPSLPCILTECVEQINTVEGKLKVESSVWERLPLLMTRASLCLVPNTRCHFAKKKTKKTQLLSKHQFKNLEDSCRPRIWRALLNVFKKSSLRFVVRKQHISLMVNGGIGFCKYQATNVWTITFALGSQGWINRWPTDQIAFLWRPKLSTWLRRSREQVSNPVSSIIHGRTCRKHAMTDFMSNINTHQKRWCDSCLVWEDDR